ncbi:MAG: S16 family serine protease [Candidatus Binatia bacterium]
MLIPADNLREAEGLPASIREQIKITSVQSIDEVLSAALLTN